MVRLSIRLILSLFFIGVSQGCTRKSEPSQFSIQLPKTSGKVVDFSRFSDDDLSDSWLGSITNADEINCYIVLASAPEQEMSRHSCLDRATNQTLALFGVYAGGVPAGGKVIIDVPAGKNRNIILLGAHALEGACLDFSGSGPLKNKITHPRVLVAKTMDLEAGAQKSVEMQIPQDLTGQSEVGRCFMDEPWGDDNGTGPAPEIQLIITDVSGGKDSMNISGGSSSGAGNTFQVTNNGNLDSTSLAGAIGLTNSTHFNIVNSTCTGVLSPDESCLIVIEPLASTNTSYSGVLSLSVDNFPSINLSGTSSGFVGPTTIISSGQPPATDNSPALNIQVGGTNVTHYKYKVGLETSIDCSTSAGYSAEISVGTLIADSPPDGDLEICIVGRDASLNWQPEVSATSHTWLKDTLAPSVTISSLLGPGSTAVSPLSLTIDFSESVSGFTLDDLTVGNASPSGFNAVSGAQYTVDLIPAGPNLTVTVNINAAKATDIAGNSNSASNAWSLSYQPDVTIDSIAWVDFFNMSSMGIVGGLDVPVELSFDVSNSSGSPIMGVRVNAGAWNEFSQGAPVTETVFNGDVIEMQVTGALGDSGDVTVTNVTDLNMVIDNVHGTVEDPCSLGPMIGTICYGGAVYAGSISTTEYMVTPSGCSDSNPPTCSGTDTTLKKWHGTTGSTSDVATITDVTDAATADDVDGDLLTANIVAHASISADSAADYCNDMSYGGYSDWYLPSKTELAYLYCKSNVASHNSLYPNEDADCIDFGGKTYDLDGFASGSWYWSSSEGSNIIGWRMNFNDGLQGQATKANSYYVRCIRKK